jgi:uncharacterized circularly permuted ATP-grasp superfamily protein
VDRAASLDGETALHGYDPADVFDEAFTSDGTPRAHYVQMLEALAECDLSKLAHGVERDRRRLGVEFSTGDAPRPFPIDPVPRIIDSREWRLIDRGLAQRARALNEFIADAYDERRIVDAGRIPARVLDSAELDEPMATPIALRGGVHAGVAGFDLVRDASGTLEVLEDNLRTPSGATYAAAAREIIDSRLPVPPPENRAPLQIAELLGETLRCAYPEGARDPVVVLLSDGPQNSAWWEHTQLAGEMDIPLVTPDDVEGRRGRICARDSGGRSFPVDVVYRRTDEDRLRDGDGRLTWVGELLFEPLRRGTVACVNAFGSGLGDDKLVHAYVEEMVRFYLGEEPLIASVPTYDVGEPSLREQVLERIEELVVKPRRGSGGHGVIVCPHASREDRELAARRVRRRPEAYVAQETITLSTHPTVVDGRLEPRHVDLRPFVFTSENQTRVLAGGLTRVALDRGALVVNSSMNGGGKDTWMLT